ncbi:MAG: hypothetical protein H6713_25295 [Myxococcales bacterium]|nr:hypothetical protein [Myxococcales bacterium]MCB9753285.1 hypothetical protein [Myxococcales bacterium]
MSQLDALVCPSCAAALPLAASTSAAGGLACRHCGAEVELPPEYVEAARTLARRVDARRQLEPLWSRLTSPPSWRWTIVAGLAVWLLPPAAVAAHIYLDDAAYTLASRLAFAAIPALLPGGLIAVVLSIWVTTAIDNAEAMAAAAPEDDGAPPRCRGCGAPLEVRDEDLIASCGYCGVDSILAGVTLRARTGRDRERLAHSLRTLEDAIARVRARRRLSLLGAALVLSPLLALGWALRWAYG